MKNFKPHKDDWKFAIPFYKDGKAVGYRVELNGTEIGIATEQFENKYRLECINGEKNHITTNVLSFIIDEMVRMYERTEVEENDD